MALPEYPGWKKGWLRYAEHEGRAVLMHHMAIAIYFVCYGSPGLESEHTLHLYTYTESQALAAFMELEEGLMKGLL